MFFWLPYVIYVNVGIFYRPSHLAALPFLMHKNYAAWELVRLKCLAMAMSYKWSCLWDIYIL